MKEQEPELCDLALPKRLREGVAQPRPDNALKTGHKNFTTAWQNAVNIAKQTRGHAASNDY